LVVLSREDALERFADHSPGLIPGIGPKTVSRLESMGIATLADLRRRDRQELESTFGPRSGAWLHTRGNLLDETPITPEHETKSQSTEITFDVDVNQRSELERHLHETPARGAHDRDQDPPRRLDQRHPLAHGRRADQRPGGGRAGRARPPARV
jgi:DNA polymerase-4